MFHRSIQKIEKDGNTMLKSLKISHIILYVIILALLLFYYSTTKVIVFKTFTLPYCKSCLSALKPKIMSYSFSSGDGNVLEKVNFCVYRMLPPEIIFTQCKQVNISYCLATTTNEVCYFRYGFSTNFCRKTTVLTNLEHPNQINMNQEVPVEVEFYDSNKFVKYRTWQLYL